ncbi:MAG TPA: HEAT repeat domain-containing protein [Candidatus Ozemobacteraceae bacterium]
MLGQRTLRETAILSFLAVVLACPSSAIAGRAAIRPDSQAVVGSEPIAAASEAINPNAVALIDDVEELLQPGRARGAYDRLVKLGAQAVPTIGRMMRGDNLRLVRAAMDLSERLGNEARQTTKDLAEAVADEKLGALRARAARILGGIGSKASEALPQLMSALNAPNRKVREAVAQAILDISTQSGRWGPELKQLLSARGRWREQAVTLLVNYGPLLHPALPFIARLVEQKPASAAEAATALIPAVLPALGRSSQAVGLLLNLAGVTEAPIGADDEALDEATVAADDAASFEDITAAE